MTLLYFVVLVGVLVLVHELGHFVWAKFFGVRVLTVSIGFGPRIAGFRRGDTEYVISLLPLGGYVRMLGDNPRDQVAPGDEARSFSAQSAWRRFLIVTGGPAMNLTFPVVLYFIVFLGDTQLTPSSVGTVFPNRPAAGKLFAGDVVTAINGEPVATFDELSRAVEGNPGVPLRFELERGGKRVETAITPVPEEKVLPLEVVRRVGRIGVMPHHPAAVLGIASPASPAGASRLRTFDVIVAAAGRPITRWVDLERALAGNPGSLVPVTYLRPAPVPDALGGLVEIDVYEPRVATLTPEPGQGSAVTRAGIELADLYVDRVRAGSPEHALGLLPGDRLVELDGRPIQLWATLLEDLRAGGGKTHTLRWRRDGEEHTGRLRLERQRGTTEEGEVFDRFVVGIRNWVPTRIDPPVPNPSPFTYAARHAVRATIDVVELTVYSVVRLVQGRLSVKTIGGPLAMLEYAGSAAREGALNYLTLMAFISVNLGLLNLLPIPLLDGGHLVFLGIETVARRPPSLRMREYAHIAGLVFLLALMTVAFKNDIERLWPVIMEQIEGG
jgi:regulator of sigma E protease